MNGWDEELKKAAECMNETHFKNFINQSNESLGD